MARPARWMNEVLHLHYTIGADPCQVNVVYLVTPNSIAKN